MSLAVADHAPAAWESAAQRFSKPLLLRVFGNDFVSGAFPAISNVQATNILANPCKDSVDAPPLRHHTYCHTAATQVRIAFTNESGVTRSAPKFTQYCEQLQTVNMFLL